MINFFKDGMQKFHSFLKSNYFSYQNHSSISRISQHYPFLANFSEMQKIISEEISPHYYEYVNSISTADMAISLETSILLAFLCKNIKPKLLLDTGSGFSSFLLRTMVSNSSDAKVVSVDHDKYWLEMTKLFLKSKGITTNFLYTWEEYISLPFEKYDLIFHDLGNMENHRKNTLSFLLRRVREGQGLLILDDMHKIPYSKFVKRYLKKMNCDLYNLKPYTLDEFQRFAMVVTNVYL